MNRSATHPCFRFTCIVALPDFLRCCPVFLVCDYIETGASVIDTTYYIWQPFLFFLRVVIYRDLFLKMS